MIFFSEIFFNVGKEIIYVIQGLFEKLSYQPDGFVKTLSYFLYSIPKPFNICVSSFSNNFFFHTFFFNFLITKIYVPYVINKMSLSVFLYYYFWSLFQLFMHFKRPIVIYVFFYSFAIGSRTCNNVLNTIFDSTSEVNKEVSRLASIVSKKGLKLRVSISNQIGPQSIKKSYVIINKTTEIVNVFGVGL